LRWSDARTIRVEYKAITNRWGASPVKLWGVVSVRIALDLRLRR
jgi:hypothetical protein